MDPKDVYEIKNTKEDAYGPECRIKGCKADFLRFGRAGTSWMCGVHGNHFMDDTYFTCYKCERDENLLTWDKIGGNGCICFNCDRNACYICKRSGKFRLGYDPVFPFKVWWCYDCLNSELDPKQVEEHRI